jgi:alpha-L-rhamnosidase
VTARPFLFCLILWLALSGTGTAGLVPAQLRCEHLENPLAIEVSSPRLSWKVESNERGQRQTAYQIRVATSREQFLAGNADLWDSGKVASDQSIEVPYAGRRLESLQDCWWAVKVWDRLGKESDWSQMQHWTMGLLEAEDWEAEWISASDPAPLHTSRDTLFLPPPRHYRTEFRTRGPVRRAMAHFSALGVAELHLNGTRVGDSFFEPGWADYAQRVHYRAHDVTDLIRDGANCLGAIVADGWYAGYVGYGLLVGYGPNRVGRYFYGKTPALLVQLEIEYADGSRARVVSDPSWRVTDQGPIREADIIMGEAYDARAELSGWSEPGFNVSGWDSAIAAGENGSTQAIFYDNTGAREMELGFQAPPRLQAYAAPPIRITEELTPQRMTEPSPGVYIFDLGQNFAGIIRLRAKGAAGAQLRIRYGEMLHPDGRLMTENLRRARATDFYTFRGDPEGETWQPRFTYHGFQFVEITGFTQPPPLDTVTGLVLHNDTPLTGVFSCSDELMTRFWLNTQWTQRGNFVEVPTDCPQRDERLGWMGDAQAYIRTASYNADVAAFFTKWLQDVEESQQSFGAYPDYAPYPMGHGHPGKTFGTAWMDAGIICPWTLWQVYGDTQVLSRHWDSMTRFMNWRMATTSPEGLGVSIGNPWGDWLNVNEPTPIEFIDTCYHALTCRMMAEMAEALGRSVEAQEYQRRFNATRAAFARAYLEAEGKLRVDTQTAYVLALWMDLLPVDHKAAAADRLARKIEENGGRMATGFLGTKPLLPVLTAHGHHDLAVRLFQSRQFPSWGYAVANGANTVWERWDSYTVEHGFDGMDGNQNAAMNSFSHYAFGAAAEWIFRDLVGIDTEGPGFQHVILRPGIPSPDLSARTKPIDWVRAAYDSIRGRIEVSWRTEGQRLFYEVELPANTMGTLHLPAADAAAIRLDDRELAACEWVQLLGEAKGRVTLRLASGRYRFEVPLAATPR